MSKVYYKLFYHVVWTTHMRQPMIRPEIERVLLPFLDNKAKRFNSCLLGSGCVEDHIHIVTEIPPSESVSDVIGKLKGSSSYFLNKELQISDSFSWQDGFGVLSFSERELTRVLKYVNNQKEHHKNGTLNDSMESTGN